MNARPLHVLMVLESSYPAERGGGAEGQVRTLARGLRARGQRVTVLVPRLRRGPQQKIARVDGVPVCRLAYPRVPLLGSVWLWLATTAFLVRRRHRYDAWHVHIAHHLAAICALLGRCLNKRVLVKVAGSWELERGTLAPGSGALNRLAYLGLRHAGAWQAISRRMAATLATRGIAASRIVALPNAVHTERFADLQRAPDMPARFIFIGRMTEEKSLDTLIDAFADIVPTHRDASLLLVGTGALETPLRQQAHRLGLGARIDFAGHRDDIEAQLCDASIGVQCSRIEGLSNTLLESMAAGLPMVASRISGNEDFVRDGENGWLFEPGDRAGLARCMARAATLTPLQRRTMGDEARATVKRQAGVEQVVARLMALYRGERAPLVATELPSRSS
ncbi:glycosyltransferase family 4 protein [Lysobacter koreensis]|uniref:Glycosyltransferase family 4 protein n=1 Tax=Lysobacter koreensis TaxID=266122 RepID=A0ABW2YJR6_9GAMM